SVLNYAEIKAIACGDPKIMERCNIEMEVNKLNVLKAGYQNQKFELQDSILKIYPQAIARCKETIQCLKEDILLRDSNPLPEQDSFVGMILDGVTYTDKAEAGNLLIELCRRNTTLQPVVVGQYRSFTITSFLSTISSEYILSLENKMNHTITLGTDKLGNILKMNNVLNNMERALEETSQKLSSVEAQLQTAKIEVENPFEKENELQEKTKRLAKLTMELKLDENDPTIIDDNEIDDIGESETKTRSRER
ncbi:MAG: helicase, partial [Longicatena sp.]